MDILETPARRARSRLRLGAVIAVTVAAAAVAVALKASPGADTAPPISATPTTTPPAVVVKGRVLSVPETLAFAPGVPLPRYLAADGAVAAAAAPPLSVRPIGRAVALYQPTFDWETAARPGRIFAMSPDSTWVALEGLRLDFIHDAGGNRANPMRTNSLSPDGRHAAFPQPHALVVVDMGTGAVARYPVAGLNEQVIWAPDGASVIVGGDDPAVRQVRLDGGTQSEVRYNVWELAEGASLVGRIEVGGGGMSQEVRARAWSDGADAPGPWTRIDQAPLGQWGMDEWYGRGWVSPGGDKVARSGFVHSGSMNGTQGVAVLQVHQGGVRATQLLAFGRDEQKGCCDVIGWLDAFTVLVDADRYGVLRWDIEANTLTRATEPVGGVLSITDLSRR